MSFRKSSQLSYLTKPSRARTRRMAARVSAFGIHDAPRFSSGLVLARVLASLAMATPTDQIFRGSMLVQARNAAKQPAFLPLPIN